jgi:GTP cyclohydrolase IA
MRAKVPTRRKAEVVKFKPGTALARAEPPDALQAAFDAVLRELGEDPTRDGLLRTPQRVALSLRYLTSGYRQDPDKVLNGALFSVAYDEMVIVRDIEVFSLCEHHLLPFFGRCHVAYIPRRRVVGLSKIPRLVDVFAHRLQVQERLTTQIAETLMDKLRPRGVGVVIEARHLCMIMRGVEKQNSVAVTSAMLGSFRDNAQTRTEFLNLVRSRPPGSV